MTETVALTSAARRRLTTVLAADIAGYSRLAETNEAAAVKTVEIVFAVFEKAVNDHHGRVFNRAGDGFFAEFPSVADGVNAAMAFIAEIKTRDRASPNAPNAKVRAGLHVGDVSEQSDGDLLGHGVNIAARLQAEAEPNGVLASLHTVNLVRDKIDAHFHRRGPLALKNIDEAVVAFDVRSDLSKSLAFPRLFKKINATHLLLIFLLVSTSVSGVFIAKNTVRPQNPQTPPSASETGEDLRIEIAADGISTERSSSSDRIWLRAVLDDLISSEIDIDQNVFRLVEKRDISAAVNLLKSKLETTEIAADRVSTLHQIGAIAFETDIDEAKLAYQQIVDSETSDFLAAARLGQLNYFQSRFAEANFHFQNALSIGTDDKPLEIYTEINFATSMIFQQKYQEAEEKLIQASQSASRSGLESLASRAETRLAFLYYDINDLSTAKETLNRIIPIQSKLKFDQDRAVSLSLLGSIAYDENNLTASRTYYLEAYDLEKATGRTLGMADALFYVGLIDYKTNEIERSAGAFDKGLNLARANNLVNMQIKNYIGKALTQKAQGDQDQACHTLKRAELLHTDEITYLPATEALIRELNCSYSPLEI